MSIYNDDTSIFSFKLGINVKNVARFGLFGCSEPFFIYLFYICAKR